MPIDSRLGVTALGATDLPEGVPVLTIMGNSLAALHGHGTRATGTVKAIYGTRSSLMTLTPDRAALTYGLSGNIAWTNRNATWHAFNGNITTGVQAAAFMAGMLGVQGTAALSNLAQTVPDAAGVAFVPARRGLGASWRDDLATGRITGMTHGTNPALLTCTTLTRSATRSPM